jgi:hypothetical protein
MAIKNRQVHVLEREGREFELWQEPADHVEPLVRLLPDGRAVVGYLVHDDDCPNPVEDCDGMGDVFGCDRSEYNTATGLDDDVPVGRPDPLAVFLHYYDRSYGQYSVAGAVVDELDARGKDVYRIADAVWVPDDSCREHILSEAARLCLPEGVKVEYRSTLNPDGTVRDGPDGKPDPRYFNVITWELPDGRSRGGYKSFLTAVRAAARALGVRFDPQELRRRERAVAVECAEQCVEELNKWLEGDCWGVVVETFDADGEQLDEDSCWGYVGSDYALSTLTDEFNAHCRALLNEKPPPPPMPDVPRTARKRLTIRRIEEIS